MRLLVACECSGLVRDAFIEIGCDAWSCDIVPSERPGPHLQCDVLDVLDQNWDMMIGFPPCTDLAVSGARWFIEKTFEQPKSIYFFNRLWTCNIPRIALENPVGIMKTYIGKPTQIIEPWMFGHGETKKTCLWLKNLPKLIPTVPVAGREQRIWKMPPSKDRARERSRTYSGIAKAMATQWGLAWFAKTLDL